MIMYRCYFPLLILAFAFFCQMVTPSASHPMCPYSGKDEEDYMKFVGTVEEFDQIEPVECMAPNTCQECTLKDRGIMFYGAACARTLEGLDGIYCTDRGLEPCSSSADTKCHPRLTLIRNLNTCRYSFSLGMVVHQGGFDVYCNDTCSSAVLIADETIYMGKSCTTDIELWLAGMVVEKPTAQTKICRGKQTCSIEGWPKVEAASASDDSSRGSNVMANRAAILAFAAICLGLAA